MRSFSSPSKLAGIILVSVLVFMAGFGQISVHAGGPAQATADATAAATTAPDNSSSAATTAATMYPPCPPASNATASVNATEAASAAAVAVTEQATTEVSVPTAAATANTNPGYLGIRAEQIDDCGVLIVEVVAGSPADKAKLQPDDVVVALDGTATPAIGLLRQGIQQKQPGDKATLTIQRGGEQMDVEVTLGTPPADTTATVESSGGEAAATAAATQ